MSTLSYKKDDAKAVDNLVGLNLKDGWVVSEKLIRGARQSGSNFSVGYIASRGEEKAFMKAFDFEKAFEEDEPMKALEILAKSYNFEKDLLQLCSEFKMTKIVRAVADGVVDHSLAPLGKIYYLLFELADGDIRADFEFTVTKTMVWRIKCLHEIAVALQQLHRRGIYHQDVKPSNVLVFGNGTESKLADLGRAHCAGKDAPHDDRKIAGAYSYAAPELIYGAPLSDKKLQRACGDLYLFGSMIYFFIVGVPLTPDLLKSLDPVHRPFLARGHGWAGAYRDVLPFLIGAHAKLMVQAHESLVRQLPAAQFGQASQHLVELLKYATSPDPELRGHPSSRRIAHSNHYDLERFITALDVIWSRARYVQSA